MVNLSKEQAETLIVLFDTAETTKRAFGAPGDYGYGTREGDALFALARAIADSRTVILDLKQRTR
jgi:hypothetical protein